LNETEEKYIITRDVKTLSILGQWTDHKPQEDEEVRPNKGCICDCRLNARSARCITLALPTPLLFASSHLEDESLVTVLRGTFASGSLAVVSIQAIHMNPFC